MSVYLHFIDSKLTGKCGTTRFICHFFNFYFVCVCCLYVCVCVFIVNIELEFLVHSKKVGVLNFDSLSQYIFIHFFLYCFR